MLHSNKFISLKENVYKLNPKVNLIVVSKNQTMDKLVPIINTKQIHFGENRVQEAIQKWKFIKDHSADLKLHLIGKLQSNKAKDAFQIFHYIHTLDNEKLAQIFSKFESNSSKKIKYFIQVNIGNEPQKSGIALDRLNQFVKYCINDLKLNIIGLMCIPPLEIDPSEYFIKLADLAKENNLNELSMGMSNDYEYAIKNGATFVRIGSKIFSED
jgi:pyridoxal phosphate enzyme (YggS family)